MKKDAELIELLQLTLSATEKLERVELEVQVAKVTIEDVSTKLMYKCMAEDLKDTAEDDSL